MNESQFIEAIEKDSELNSLIFNCGFSSIERVYSNKDKLLSFLTADKFLELALKCPIESYDSETKKYRIDLELVQQQAELIDIAINRGANVSEWPFETFNLLYAHKDNDAWIKLLMGTVNEFLALAVYSTSYIVDIETGKTKPNQERIQKQLELIEKAIGMGADVNYEPNGGGGNPVISLSGSMDIANLLVRHGAMGMKNNINAEEMIEGGWNDIFLKPEFIIEQKYKNLNAPEAIDPKIPYILHHIWLTHPSSPREIRAQDIENALEVQATFSKGKGQWEQIVWTNDRSLIPNSVEQLEKAGIQVRSIYEYEDELSLFYLIERLIENKEWGKATDTLRYSLVEKLGGVYADINFIFNRDTTSEAHKYNFFTMTSGDTHYIDNFFFGASPEHPIIKKILLLVERNLVSPPHYLASIKDQTSQIITDMGTANPTYLAYYIEANKGGNVDVVYPDYPHFEIEHSIGEDRDSRREYYSDEESEGTRLERLFLDLCLCVSASSIRTLWKH